MKYKRSGYIGYGALTFYLVWIISFTLFKWTNLAEHIPVFFILLIIWFLVVIWLTEDFGKRFDTWIDNHFDKLRIFSESLPKECIHSNKRILRKLYPLKSEIDHRARELTNQLGFVYNPQMPLLALNAWLITEEGETRIAEVAARRRGEDTGDYIVTINKIRELRNRIFELIDRASSEPVFFDQESYT